MVMLTIYRIFLKLLSILGKLVILYGAQLGIADKVRAALLGLNEDIFIPELGSWINY